MGSVQVKVDTSRLESKIREAVKVTHKSLEKIVRNVAINFSQAASKESKPEPGKAYNRLSKKAKMREIVNMYEGLFWYHNPARDSVFVKKYRLPSKEVKSRGLIMAKKGVVWWNKKKNAWAIFGYFPSFTDRKRIPIPHAGYGKLGWKSVIDSLRMSLSNSFSAAQITTAGDKVKCTIHNKIRYASKVTSPGVLGRARDAAMKMIDKVYLSKKLKKVR